MDDLSLFCCQNSPCEQYGKWGGENLTVTDRSRRYHTLRCRACKARFSERKGTVFYDSRLPQEKVVSILAHVSEGVGMRKTGRLMGVKDETVIRYCPPGGGSRQSVAR